ncbi:NAD-dependent epimerase/dehydratase family protein [Brevibacillus sp. GCM10020057]|uniref:NAD-dependent epimerase/dehydratase family protein n=1 Tax=Brevibacillus sp. GCM10020057 TaxID=3317327 RepID=UPI00364136D0
MTVLLIGGGLIGAHIAKECTSSGEETVVISYNPDHIYLKMIAGLKDEQIVDMAISNPSDLIKVLTTYNIRRIVIAAGSLHNSFMKHTGMAILNESRLLLAIYAALFTYQIEKLIYVSSLAVYGPSNSRCEEEIPKPVSAYGITKFYNEQIINAIAKQFSITALVIRPSGVIGPNPKRCGNWMSGEINRALQEKMEPILISSQLSTPNEYLDVRDLAQFITGILLGRNGIPSFSEFDIVNIGTGKLVDGGELILKMSQIVGREIVFTSNGVETPKQRLSSALPISKAIERYGYNPKTDISESLAYIGGFYAK